MGAICRLAQVYTVSVFDETVGATDLNHNSTVRRPRTKGHITAICYYRPEFKSCQALFSGFPLAIYGGCWLTPLGEKPTSPYKRTRACAFRLLASLVIHRDTIARYGGLPGLTRQPTIRSLLWLRPLHGHPPAAGAQPAPQNGETAADCQPCPNKQCHTTDKGTNCRCLIWRHRRQ